MIKKLIAFISLLGLPLLLAGCLDVNADEADKIRVAIYDTAIMDIIDAAGYDNFNISALGTPHTLLKGDLTKYADDSVSINLGIHTAVNYENLQILNPDVIILSSRFEQHRDAITAAVPNARVYTGKYENTEFYSGLLRNVEMLKEVFPAAADNIDNAFNPVKQAILSFREDVMTFNKSVLVLLANGNNIATYGTNGRFDMIFSTFGFRDALTGFNDASVTSCTDMTHGCNIGPEIFSKLNPDVVLIIDRAASVDGAVSASVTTLKESMFFKSTTAYTNNAVYDLSSDAFYVNPGGVNSTKVMIQNLRQVIGA